MFSMKSLFDVFFGIVNILFDIKKYRIFLHVYIYKALLRLNKWSVHLCKQKGKLKRALTTLQYNNGILIKKFNEIPF